MYSQAGLVDHWEATVPDAAPQLVSSLRLAQGEYVARLKEIEHQAMAQQAEVCAPAKGCLLPCPYGTLA